MPLTLAATDRLFLVTALYALKDRHPALAQDPLWHWMAEELAPAKASPRLRGLEGDDLHARMLRLLARARRETG